MLHFKSCLSQYINHSVVTQEVTCSKGKEEALVCVFPQKCHHSLPHPLIPLVDELLSEVAVYLLSRHLLVGRERRVDEVGDLRSVVIEYDGIQVSTIIMLDEIFSGIRGLQTTCSETFMLEQSLV